MLCQKKLFFFVKREIPLLFFVNCERADLFFVKRDLYPPFTTLLGLSRHFTTHGPCGDSINKRTVTLVGQSSVERTSQKRVYHKDLSFHRKYGSKNEATEMCAPSPVIPRSWVNSPTSSVYYEENDDDCARSFCDSVSSIACSHFTNNDVGKQTERRNILSDKVSKLKSIESWLQGVSKPLL